MDTIKLKREEMKELLKEAMEEHMEEHKEEERLANKKEWGGEFVWVGLIFYFMGWIAYLDFISHEFGEIAAFVGFAVVGCILLLIGILLTMKERAERKLKKLEAKA